MQTIKRYTKKIGNSLAIIIGKFVCEDENIEEGDKLKIKILEVEKHEKWPNYNRNGSCKLINQ